MMAAVGVGGAIVAELRYRFSLSARAGIFCVNGPLTTLVVNDAGSTLMGCLSGSVVGGMVLPQACRGFLAFGVLAALTTFSSFTLDAGQLWQRKGVMMAAVYVVVSVVLSLVAFWAMFLVARHSGGIWQ